VRGRYINADYGFSVEIAAGFVGQGSLAPNPNHGFRIQLDNESAIWVDASYDMDAARDDAPHAFGTINARLGKLEAERKSWSDTVDGVERFHDEIVASDRGILYTIQADTTVKRRPDALRVFETLINSFATIPIRP
jgi:hypothetical protein